MGQRTKIIGAAVLVAAGAGLASAVVLGNAGAKREAMIPAGLPIVAVLQHRVSTETTGLGDSIELRTVEPLRLDSKTVLPADIVIRGDVASAKGGGRMSGAPEIALRFTQLELDGKSYPISADPFRVTGKSAVRETAAEIGGGALAGGLLGGVLGGGSGVAKGAVAGAALGTGVAVATKGDQLVLPAGQRIKVHLNEALSVQYSTRSEKPKKMPS